MRADDEILDQIDRVIADVERTENLYAAKARLSATIERLAPNSAYVAEAQALRMPNMQWYVTAMIEMLRCIRADYEGGYMRRIEELVHANVFSDFLAMAEELLNKRYKDPAAVLAGTVLEGHLRSLAVRHDVPYEDAEGRRLRANRLNADLASAEVYNGLEQKNVTAWLDLRNKAAHGDFEQYESGHVAALIQSVREFMIRHPA